jgi:DUF4097 and DUF4098 domain-containing protein YvlB
MPEHRFHTPGPVQLEVSVPAGEVLVETHHGEESVVVVEGNEKLVEQTVVELHGDRLTVAFRGQKPFGITIEIGGWSFGSEKLRVHARIPHASAAQLVTASADMRIEGTLRELETKTASGDLYMRGAIEGDAKIKTVSGDVYLGDVAGTFEVNSVSGDVRVDDVGGAVKAKSVSGDVRIGAARGSEATLQSISGDIVVGVASGTNLDVDANSVSGDLESEVPLGSESDGVLGDGPLLVVRGKTVSGDFRVVRA